MALPLGVRKDEFSVGKPFCSGAGEKETQTLKVVWEKCSKKFVYLRGVFGKTPIWPTCYIFIMKTEKNAEKTPKKRKKIAVSAGGLGRRIFSRETLLLRGRRKGDPDTKSGLEKMRKTYEN